MMDASIGDCGGVGFCRETGIHIVVDGEALIGDAVDFSGVVFDEETDVCIIGLSEKTMQGTTDGKKCSK